jgi:cellulose synthase/poly-beta-1,6-N-acetylglucosamine synthase-like glycosyltransferase
MSVLNDAVRESKGEIVVFSDAAAILQPDSLRQLVANFADPKVGAAGGHIKCDVDRTTTDNRVLLTRASLRP